MLLCVMLICTYSAGIKNNKCAKTAKYNPAMATMLSGSVNAFLSLSQTLLMHALISCIKLLEKLIAFITRDFFSSWAHIKDPSETIMCGIC